MRNSKLWHHTGANSAQEEYEAQEALFWEEFEAKYAGHELVEAQPIVFETGCYCPVSDLLPALKKEGFLTGQQFRSFRGQFRDDINFTTMFTEFLKNNADYEFLGISDDGCPREKFTFWR